MRRTWATSWGRRGVDRSAEQGWKADLCIAISAMARRWTPFLDIRRLRSQSEEGSGRPCGGCWRQRSRSPLRWWSQSGGCAQAWQNLWQRRWSSWSQVLVCWVHRFEICVGGTNRGTPLPEWSFLDWNVEKVNWLTWQVLACCCGWKGFVVNFGFSVDIVLVSG